MILLFDQNESIEASTPDNKRVVVHPVQGLYDEEHIALNLFPRVRYRVRVSDVRRQSAIAFDTGILIFAEDDDATAVIVNISDRVVSVLAGCTIQSSGPARRAPCSFLRKPTTITEDDPQASSS